MALLEDLKPHIWDVVHRLNCFYTPLVLLLFSVLVGAKQYLGSPIQCFAPAQFSKGWVQYVNDYCFVKNTYFVAFNQQIPDQTPSRIERELGYYQWVPIVLAIQALLFVLPNLVWKMFSGQTGINLKAILKSAKDSFKIGQRDERQKQLKDLARHIEDTLGFQKQTRFRWLRHFIGSYVSYLHLHIKLLYLTNVFVQLLLLNRFLDTSNSFWGIQIFMDLLQGREWQESGHFPRVTLCDFEVRRIGNVHHHTVQCVLTINMFNEKIYIFVWFWLLLVAALTAANLFYWLYATVLDRSNARIIYKYLRISHHFEDGIHQRTVDRFISALRPDGVLVLRFIGALEGDLVATELTGILWKDFLELTALHHVNSDATSGSQEDDAGSTQDLIRPHTIDRYPGRHNCSHLVD